MTIKSLKTRESVSRQGKNKVTERMNLKASVLKLRRDREKKMKKNDTNFNKGSKSNNLFLRELQL